MTEIMQFLAYGELADIFHVADSMTNLYYDNRMGCGYQQIVKTIGFHCKGGDLSDLKHGKVTKEDGKRCTTGTLFNNLFTVHMFETMGSATTLVNGVKELEWDVDADYIHDQYLSIGKSAGSLLAYAYDI